MTKKGRTWIAKTGWRLLLVALIALPTWRPVAPARVQAAGPVSAVVPIAGLVAGLHARNRVYRTANAYIKEKSEYYDRLHAEALKQFQARQVGGLRASQVAAFVKVVRLIERERQAMIDFAESEKRAARKEFIDRVNNIVVNAMLSTTAATRVLGAMQKGLRSSKDMIDHALGELAGGGTGVLGDVQRVRRTASWVSMGGEMIGGRVGGRIRSAANQVVRTIDRPTAEIQAGLEQARGDLDELSGMVGDLQAKGYQPTAGEVTREVLISAVTGDRPDPAVEAIVDLLSAKAGRADGSFRDRARAAVTGQAVARCAAIGARYREVLFRLQMPATDETALETIEVPSCNVTDLEALAQEDGKAPPAAPDKAQDRPGDGGQAGSPTATATVVTPATATPAPTRRWVRGQPVINVEGHPLEYRGGGSTPGYFSEERFEGMFTIYRVSETSIAVDDRWVDRGWEAHNITIQSVFDAPRAVLTPGEVITLTVKFAHSGTVTDGNPGAAFQYSADKAHRGIIRPAEPLPYYPWAPGFDGTASKAWTLTAPQGRPGDTFQVWAAWWNCPVCNVIWEYKLE